MHDVVTGQQRPLTQQPRGSSGRAGYSALSPDGQQVAYGWESLETGRGELRLVGLDTGGARVLYENEEVTWVHPNAWTPDGKYILALFVRKDETNQIVLVSVADGSVRVLKSLDWNYPRHVGLSPDGRYIVYDSRLDENSPNRDIFLLATDGSREIPLIEHPADDTGPVWTPDGTKVVFASDRTGSTSAWVLRVADEKAQGPPELVKPDLGRFFPIGFDRKGSYYYELHTGMTDVYLATLNPVTGQLDAAPRRATQRFVGATYGADWSPDGRYLAYVRRGQREALLELGSTVIIQSLDTGTERELNPCHQTGALRGGQPRRRALCDNPRWPNGHRRSPQAPRPRTVSSCCHVHGGTGPMPLSALRYQALNNPTMTRFLAAGYVTMIPTYHSSEDPQALDALWDTLAIVDHLKEMREVDPNSVVVYGCSVGGDLVLEIAGETEVAATTSEEPITIGFTGILNRDTPMRGASFTVANAVPLLEDPRSFYTPAIRRLTQERIRKINGPIFIAQGDQQLDGVVDHHKIVNEILIPELQAAGKELEEIVYPGQGHCFGFRGGIGGEEEAASTFFADMDAFFKRHLPTQPHAVEDSLVAHVPVSNRDRVALTVSSEILAAYVGTYEIGPGQNIVVTLEGNQLMTGGPRLREGPVVRGVRDGVLQQGQSCPVRICQRRRRYRHTRDTARGSPPHDGPTQINSRLRIYRVDALPWQPRRVQPTISHQGLDGFQMAGILVAVVESGFVCSTLDNSTLVHGLPARLFRRHIRRRSHDHAHLRGRCGERDRG